MAVPALLFRFFLVVSSMYRVASPYVFPTARRHCRTDQEHKTVHFPLRKYIYISLTSILFLGIDSEKVAAQSIKNFPPKLHHVATGRDPFNRTQADTTESFVKLLQNNPTLRKRYSRHFGVPENTVIQFVRHALVPYTLPAARTPALC